MKKYLPFVIVGSVACLTVVGASLLYRAKLPPPQQASSATGEQAAPSEGHLLGPTDAPVTIEEYGDFQCPPCGTLSAPLSQLVDQSRPRIRLIYHEFPLPVHLHARAAATAAEAAGLQGKFWPMHDLLYREQTAWSKATDVREVFESYARILGLDVNRFNHDVDGPAAVSRVETDHKAGEARGVQSTPTVFLNKTRLEPKSLNPSGIHAAVDEILKMKSAP